MSVSSNVPMFLYKICHVKLDLFLYKIIEQKRQRKLKLNLMKLNLMQILVLFLDKFSVAFKI